MLDEWMQNNIELTPPNKQALPSKLDLDSVLKLSTSHKDHERASNSGNNSVQYSYIGWTFITCSQSPYSATEKTEKTPLSSPPHNHFIYTI